MLVSLIMVTVAFGFNNKGMGMSIIKKEALNQAFSLAIDMYEKDGNIIVKMDIPGIDSSDIQVEVEDGQLHVFGERRAKEEVKEENYYYKETGYGRFDRLVSLPADIDKAGMSYEIGDGILTVVIPKK
jgi:HSP20 family protein